MPEVARELGLSTEGLRGWVKQAKIDRGDGPAGSLTTAAPGRGRIARGAGQYGRDPQQPTAAPRLLRTRKGPVGG
ncbi:hypothetical protein [Streptomyces sp. NPDC056661]|uniref:hypothetical protein n=1 Tax=Streptomyces sp. NPDC056661 TaxID=3345898 RepID=UPI0036BB4263